MRLSLPVIALLALAACGTTAADANGDGGSDGRGGNDVGGNGGTGNDGGSGAGGSGGQIGGGCTTTNQCPDGQVCDPATNACTAQPIGCASHEDCGAAAFCNESGVCEPNTTGGPCTGDAMCQAGEVCTGGFCGCEGDQFQAEAVPPNVLVMLDKSKSMEDLVDGTAKWDIALGAVEQLLADYGDKVRFGLMLYPTGDRCGAGSVTIDVADGTASAILAALHDSGPSGYTPIGASLHAALDYAGLEDAGRANFVLLLTDGDETCDGNGEDSATELRDETPEVKTFVVGFGGEVDSNELNRIAVAGGTELPGTTKYYQADDAASLATAFADIGGAVLSCSYQLSAEPDSADDVFVYFDGEAIPRDASHDAGWDHDASTNQITFYGDACAELRTGTVKDLVIVQGCPLILD